MNQEAPARNRYAQALAGGRIMNKELRMFYVIASRHSERSEESRDPSPPAGGSG